MQVVHNGRALPRNDVSLALANVGDGNTLQVYFAKALVGGMNESRIGLIEENEAGDSTERNAANARDRVNDLSLSNISASQIGYYIHNTPVGDTISLGDITLGGKTLKKDNRNDKIVLNMVSANGEVSQILTDRIAHSDLTE